MRGGTSKGLFFRRDDLPPAGPERDAILLRAIGPDATGMQLDGCGGGVSSTSKVAIVGPSAHHSCDLDYEFGQVSLTEQRVEHDQNCGNLASAVGIFALREGLLELGAKVLTTLRIFQVNTGSRMEVTVPSLACEQVSIPGVAGAGLPVHVRWVSPAVGRLRGPPSERLMLRGLRSGAADIEVTLVEAGNPAVIVRAADIGAAVHGSDLDWELVDELREAAARRLGVTLSSAMRLILVGLPRTYDASDGRRVDGLAFDLCASITTDGRRVHHVFTGTGSVNLAAAARVKGSVPHSLLAARAQGDGGKRAGTIVLGHPGGTMQVAAEVAADGECGWRTLSASLMRTARILFRGEVALH